MWATNFSSGTVSKIDPAGAEPGTAVTYATGTNPCGISSDGTSIWVTNFSANTVSVIHARQPHPTPGSAQVVAPSGALSTANNREHISGE
jgi:DNA-binding beta-propeller fold protein YncE